MRWRVQLLSLVTAAALLLTCATVFGGTVPNTLNYQGTLYDGNGQPVTGTRDVTVSLYDVASGGTAFWTETQAGTLLKNGNFSVVLGKSSNNPLDQAIQAKLTGETYIGIKIGNDAELVPRQQFTSAAYALKSGDGVPIGAIIMWSGGTVPSGWALCDGTNGTPNLRDRFIVGAGSSYSVGSTGGNVTINLQHSHSGSTSGPNESTRRLWDSNGNQTATDSHVHSFSTDSRLSTAQDIRPPYYALAFIMKVQ